MDLFVLASLLVEGEVEEIFGQDIPLEVFHLHAH